jgi:hypothetical protein
MEINICFPSRSRFIHKSLMERLSSIKRGDFNRIVSGNTLPKNGKKAGDQLTKKPVKQQELRVAALA